MTDITPITLPLIRPRPPAEMLAEFEPAPDVWEWLRRVFLDEKSPLFNEDHEHLTDADVGVLWTHVENVKQQRRVVGMAEIPNFRGNAWQKARGEMQLREWFGRLPDFVITLSAPYCAEVDDAGFCALNEHELYHCAQDLDKWGSPRFSQSTGRPLFAIKNHDVEQFLGVVRRYGRHASGVDELVRAAEAIPLLQSSSIAGACGTCQAMAA